LERLYHQRARWTPRVVMLLGAIERVAMPPRRIVVIAGCLRNRRRGQQHDKAETDTPHAHTTLQFPPASLGRLNKPLSGGV
jgi:hypothetical protein